MTNAPAAKDNPTTRYRQRLRASGATEVLVHLPRELVVVLDSFKERQGLRNRSQALQQLIEEWRAASPRTA